MKILITGTSSGIGRAIALKLIKEEHEVYGISRTSANIDSSFFHEYLLNLTDLTALERLVRQLNKEISFDVLINNAGCGYYGLHEELNSSKIHEMVTTNLEVPMIMCNLLMRTLKANSGCIINISSVTAKQHNPHGAAYGATKAGLTSLSASLFDEARKYGVRVVAIHPEMTDTELYRNADFGVYPDTSCYLTPDSVADAVMYAINVPSGMVINDITMNPQFHRIQRKQ